MIPMRAAGGGEGEKSLFPHCFLCKCLQLYQVLMSFKNIVFSHRT